MNQARNRSDAHILIAGAGIGGLGAALALGQLGKNCDIEITVLEQADVFGEVGAGVQISPNAYQVLCAWGLADALNQTANFPQRLQVRSATSHQLLGQLALGDKAVSRYGCPFATLHRADLHRLLLDAVRQLPNVTLHLNAKTAKISETNQQVSVTTASGERFSADVLIGADGLRSRVRPHVIDDDHPNPTGHTAWRALISLAHLADLAEVPPEILQDLLQDLLH